MRISSLTGTAKLRLAAIPCVLVFAAAAAAGLTANSKDIPSDTSETVAVTSESEQYIVTEYSGNIAVYSEGNDTPMMVTDIPVSHLREADREMLEAGINAEDMTEILKLLEDFGS